MATALDEEDIKAYVLQMLQQSGVKAWADPDTLDKISAAAVYLYGSINENLGIIGGGVGMAVTSVFRTQSGTQKKLKSSGGDAAVTLASLANGSMRQAATLDLGATRAAAYRLETQYEFAATPTAGNLVNHFGSFSDSSGAGNANTSGSDASYTGYSSNAAASVKQLIPLPPHVLTTQATSTVQKCNCGVIYPTGRYLNFVVDNESGIGFHTSDTNCQIILTPVEDTAEPS